MSSSIPSRIAASFKEAVDDGSITLYETDSVHAVTTDPLVRAAPVPHGEGVFKQFVHVIPKLSEKPAVPPKTPDLTKAKEEDPFEAPFGPGEEILALPMDPSDPAAVKVTLLENKFALCPEHIMAVPAFSGKPFRPQTSDLTPADLAAAWMVVEAYAKDGKEAVCFFNGGPLAGASQPHLHLQFIPFQHSTPPACEALARALPFPPSAPSPSAPSHLFDAANSTSGPDAASRLPLPWVQFYLPLPPRPSSSASLSETRKFEKQLYERYETLLNTRKDFIATKEEAGAELPTEGPKRNSYNLYLTAEHMFLTPRTDRLVRVPRVASKGKEGAEGDEFALSINGFAYLGLWFVANEEEEKDLLRHGLSRTLRECGYANEEWEEEEKKQVEGVDGV